MQPTGNPRRHCRQSPEDQNISATVNDASPTRSIRHLASRALPFTGGVRLVTGVVLTSVALVTLISLTLLPTRQVSPTPAARQSSPATLSATSTATAPAPVPDPATQGSPPLHISYPAAGMNQDVLTLTPAVQGPDSGTVDPPLTLDAYWLTPYGSPGAGSTNTTYIIGHSWEDRGSAFNNLSTQANPGDRLTVTTAAGTINYTVTAVTTENKNTLKDSTIWSKVPNRLILISCYTGDLWGKNVIIKADPTITPNPRTTQHAD